MIEARSGMVEGKCEAEWARAVFSKKTQPTNIVEEESMGAMAV